jgi:hypothetical protein
MGDMADFAREQEEMYEEPGLILHNPEIYWRTISGDLIAINNMTTSHIENTLKMLERNDNQSHPSYFALVLEYEKRIHEILAR